MTKDLERLGKYFNVPLTFPADPFEAMFDKGTLSRVSLLNNISSLVYDDPK